MRSYTYNPTTYKVADTYQNYTTGGTQNILTPNEVIQFKSDTDREFGKVMEVFNDHHNELFKLLQSLTLDYRLNDHFCSLVS